jgi:hypothetical protein
MLVTAPDARIGYDKLPRAGNITVKQAASPGTTLPGGGG